MDELPAQIDLPRSMGLNLRYCSRMVQYYDSLIIFEPMLNVIKAFQVEQVSQGLPDFTELPTLQRNDELFAVANYKNLTVIMSGGVND